ncbi:type IV pilin protein [Lacisediminimonas profundi]|uniref:type IV pilin protein n=1 Tax=Lacisediminimonas profundi TaxID=2603856 RepID=UPI00124AEA65|nr:prepilin-type N-terminal cleavage/methylation domain-containing protein [Lacisediminimonas profundi]
MSPVRTSHGFSLIELLVVMAIIAIISAVAVPNYSDYITRARVSESTSALAVYRIRLEQYYQDNRNYGGKACGVAAPQASRFFSYACDWRSSGQGYLASAAGIAGTSTESFTFTLDQDGARTTTSLPTGWGSANQPCWILAKGNRC